jgi:hypothetical protein
MTDVFRSEILAVVMQQILDEPVLPTLFMRTVSRDFPRFPRSTALTRAIKVIQAVKTYKSLTGFVSTTLLSRLITKKIWTTPLLWEGFIRCAQIVAPASFLGAVAASERATTGASGEATKLARPTTRLCPEKRWQSCTSRRLLGDHWRRRAAGRGNINS